MNNAIHQASHATRKEMGRIGILGGLDYKSTLHYYEGINHLLHRQDQDSADIVLRSVRFRDYFELILEQDWENIGWLLSSEAWNLAHGTFCDYIILADIGMHKVADAIIRYIESGKQRPDRVNTRFIHIGDCIAETCHDINAQHILLLGNRFIMTDGFMANQLARHGITAMSTEDYPDEIETINRIIFQELHQNIVTSDSKEFMLNFAYQFPADSDERPDAIVLCNHELNMILEPEDLDIPIIDATQVHINKIVKLIRA